MAANHPLRVEVARNRLAASGPCSLTLALRVVALLLYPLFVAAAETNRNSPLAAGEPKAVRTLDIAPVWSGHPVGFALLTSGKRQLVAFYDAERRMTVGSRGLHESRWQLVPLPSVLGWDSHNYVTLAVDHEGQIHLSGNMHCQPLIYFRTTRPYDITSFQRVRS